MTIKRGEEWGSLVSRPVELVIATTDAELHRLLNAAMRSDERLAVGLVNDGGDLARTVAASKDPAELEAAPELQRLPMDCARTDFDGRSVWFCSHAIIRRPGWRAWRGPLTALMNAQFIGNWDVAPRSHPNDGRLDIIAIIGRLDVRQRQQAKRRLVTGTHLPHPALGETRSKQWHGRVERDQVLLLDGETYTFTGELTVTVQPDALDIYI